MINRLRVFRLFSTINLTPSTCYYKTLNVPSYATVTEIRLAYLEQVKKFHPDINK